MTMKEVLEGVKVLEGWANIKVLPEIEEKIDDISFIVKYNLYGDEYLIIGTRDGHTYEYGCYANLKFDSYNYLRNPVLKLTEVEGSLKKTGIAGKIKIDRAKEYIVVDKLIFAYVNDKKIEPTEILEYWRRDRWGEDQYMILLNNIRSRAWA